MVMQREIEVLSLEQASETTLFIAALFYVVVIT